MLESRYSCLLSWKESESQRQSSTVLKPKHLYPPSLAFKGSPHTRLLHLPIQSWPALTLPSSFCPAKQSTPLLLPFSAISLLLSLQVLKPCGTRLRSSSGVSFPSPRSILTFILGVMLCGMWDHSSLTRGWTHASCIGSLKSSSLDRQELPILTF